jgi:hypothetical protein
MFVEVWCIFVAGALFSFVAWLKLFFFHFHFHFVVVDVFSGSDIKMCRDFETPDQTFFALKKLRIKKIKNKNKNKINKKKIL